MDRMKIYLEPKDDITLQELSSIVVLLLCGANHDINDNAFKFLDIKTYKEFENKFSDIMRHFRVEKLGE